MEILLPKFKASDPLLKDLYKHSEYLTRHLPLAGHYFAMFQRILTPTMPEDYLQFLRRGAELHDIGKKVALPILEKPEYSFAERRLVETHPTEGGRLLARLYGVNHPYTVMAAYHHERFDGKGYPQRMKGTAIPEYARTMALADIFSTITQPRPYNAKIFTPTEALELLEQESGKIFDPDLVRPIVERLKYEFE